MATNLTTWIAAAALALAPAWTWAQSSVMDQLESGTASTLERMSRGDRMSDRPTGVIRAKPISGKANPRPATSSRSRAGIVRSSLTRTETTRSVVDAPAGAERPVVDEPRIARTRAADDALQNQARNDESRRFETRDDRARDDDARTELTRNELARNGEARSYDERIDNERGYETRPVVDEASSFSTTVAATSYQVAPGTNARVVRNPYAGDVSGPKVYVPAKTYRGDYQPRTAYYGHAAGYRSYPSSSVRLGYYGGYGHHGYRSGVSFGYSYGWNDCGPIYYRHHAPRYYGSYGCGPGYSYWRPSYYCGSGSSFSVRINIRD